MVIDIAHNPRLSQLVGRIEEVRRALVKLPPHAPERARYEQSLAGFYVEVGKYVHWLLRQDPATLARVEAEARRWAAEMDAYLAGRGEVRPAEQPAVDVEVEALDALPDEASVADWTHDSAMRSGDEELPSRTAHQPLRELEVELLAEDAGGDEGTLASAEMPEVEAEALIEDMVELEPEDSRGVPVVRQAVTVSVAERVSSARRPDEAWSEALRQIVEQLGDPEPSLDDAESCEREKRRVVNATTNMESRWILFPDDIQRALLGAVSSRARAVQLRMAVDVELRLALGRMRRFREARGLGTIASLEVDAVPERDDWMADAREWWSALVAAA